jgi:hypothetical protein
VTRAVVPEAGGAGRPRRRRDGVLARLQEGLAQAQAHGAAARRRRCGRGARPLDGEWIHAHRLVIILCSDWQPNPWRWGGGGGGGAGKKKYR